LNLTDLGTLSPLLKLIPQKTLGNDIIGAKTPKFDNPPEEIKSSEGLLIEGSVLFAGKNVDCRIIVGALKIEKTDLPDDLPDEEAKDTAKDMANKGKKLFSESKRTVYSLAIFLPAGFKVADLKVLKDIPGVSKDTFDRFGAVDLPEGELIISNFNYTDPRLKIKIPAGISIVSKTKVKQLLSATRAEIDLQTHGRAKDLPFIAKVKDDEPILFKLSLGFEGSLFKSIAAELFLPTKLGIDFANLRKIESGFTPKFAKPFDNLNKSVKAVTSVLNQSPLNVIKEASIENVIAVIKYDKATMLISFATELYVTANNGDHYGMRGAVLLTLDQLIIELQKAPSIDKMHLGNGVYMKEVALSVVADFIMLASTGVPISGIGFMGVIDFPDAAETATVSLGGEVDIAKNGLLMMGQVQNLDVTKLAQFNVSLIENFGKKVGFDSSKMTKSMQGLPKIKVNNGELYFASADMKLNGKDYKTGFGVGLDVTVADKYTGRMAMIGNAQNLSADGSLSPIIIKDIVTITGPGPDGKYDTKDDGVVASFTLSSEKPEDAKFNIAGRIAFPAIKTMGEGELFMGAEKVKGNFNATVQDLFTAKFYMDFKPKDVAGITLGFNIENEQREKLMELIYQGLDKAAKAQEDVMGKALKSIQSDLNIAKSSSDYKLYQSQKDSEKANRELNQLARQCKDDWAWNNIAPSSCKRALSKGLVDVGVNGVNVLVSKSENLVTSATQKAFDNMNKLNDKFDITKKGQEKVLSVLSAIQKGSKALKLTLPTKVSADITARDWKAKISIIDASITLPDPVGKVTLTVEDFVLDMKNPTKSFESIGKVLLKTAILPKLGLSEDLISSLGI
jgi:hypothetical protein